MTNSTNPGDCICFLFGHLSIICRQKHPPTCCRQKQPPHLRLKHHDRHTSMADDVLQRFRKSNWGLDWESLTWFTLKWSSPKQISLLTYLFHVKHGETYLFLDVWSVTEPDPNKCVGRENRYINTKWPVLLLFFVVLVTAWIIRKTNHVAWTLRVGMEEFVPFWGCVVCRSCTLKYSMFLQKQQI